MLSFLHSADATAASKGKAAAPKAAATAAITIAAPASGATVSGTVAITAQIGSGVSWINIYIDGSYLTSSPPLTYEQPAPSTTGSDRRPWLYSLYLQ